MQNWKNLISDGLAAKRVIALIDSEIHSSISVFTWTGARSADSDEGGTGGGLPVAKVTVD